MVCLHCSAATGDNATTCSSCGKPTSVLRRSSRNKRASRHDPAQAAEKAPTRDDQEPVRGTSNLPALLGGALDPQRQPSTAVALVPQTLSAAQEPAPTIEEAANRPAGGIKRKAWATSAVVAAAFIVALGGWWRNNGEPPAGAINTAPMTALAEDKHEGDLPATARVSTPDTKIAVATKNPASSNAKVTKKAHDTAAASVSKSGSSDKNRPARAMQPPKKSQSTTQTAASREPDRIVMASAAAGQSRYAQCLELEGFLRREQCKWHVCSGKWGQDGCPSYKKDDEVNY